MLSHGEPIPTRVIDDLSGLRGAIGDGRPDAPLRGHDGDDVPPAVSRPHPAHPQGNRRPTRGVRQPADHGGSPGLRHQARGARQPPGRGQRGDRRDDGLRHPAPLSQGHHGRASQGAGGGADVGPFRHPAARDRADAADRPRRVHHRLAQHPRRAEGGRTLQPVDLCRGGDAFPAGAGRGRASRRRLPADRPRARRRRLDGGGRRRRRAALDHADGRPDRHADQSHRRQQARQREADRVVRDKTDGYRAGLLQGRRAARLSGLHAAHRLRRDERRAPQEELRGHGEGARGRRGREIRGR